MKPMLEPGSELIKSADALSEALHNNLMDWQVKPVSRTDNIETIVKPRTIGDIRLIELSGAPFCGTRERAEIGYRRRRVFGGFVPADRINALPCW